MGQGHGHDALTVSSAALQLVRPAGARFEGLLLAAVAALIVAALALYVRELGRHESHEPLYEWQVSAFDAGRLGLVGVSRPPAAPTGG